MLKATSVEVGLLLNFGPEAKFKRVVYDNLRKQQTPIIREKSNHSRKFALIHANPR